MPQVSTAQTPLRVDQRHRMRRPRHIVPRAITRRSDATGPATAAATDVRPQATPLEANRQPTVRTLAVALHAQHSEPWQSQNPRTIASRSHRSSLVVGTSREDDTGWSGARGIALTARSPSRPPSQQRSAQATGYSAQMLVLKSTKSPKTSRSRIKRLRGLSQPQYRLRVNDIRVFYDVTATSVEILAIIEKQEAQAWLDQEGTPGEGGGSGQG